MKASNTLLSELKGKLTGARITTTKADVWGEREGGQHCGFGRTKGLISHSGLFFSECLLPFRMKIFTLAARIMRKIVTCAEHPAGSSTPSACSKDQIFTLSSELVH